MTTTWVVAADASRARIFEAHTAQRDLHEIETFVHLEGRAPNRELKTDIAGRLFSKGKQQAHAVEPNVDPAMHELELFTKRITAYLDKARSDNRYEVLYVLAPPRLLGLIRKHLSKPTLKLLSATLPKDVSWFEEHDLERYLIDHGVARDSRSG